MLAVLIVNFFPEQAFINYFFVIDGIDYVWTKKSVPYILKISLKFEDFFAKQFYFLLVQNQFSIKAKQE